MRLLLDSHLSSELAAQLRGHGVDAVALAEWQNGAHLRASDRALLDAAHLEGRVLLTLDVHTIPDLLIELAASGGHHAGVVFVARKTLAPNDIGGLLTAILAFVRDAGNDWQDRSGFLRRR